MTGPARQPRIITFGCRLNIADSEAIRQELGNAGEDVVIVNTCAVTGEAVRQARQQIRRIRREDAAARIIVTGCAAQIEPERFAAMPEVDRVLGNVEKFDPAQYRFDTGLNDPVRVNDIMAVRDTAPHLLRGFAEHTRAFVEVQTGCDHRCTFCVIPFGRGNSRSAPAGLVVDRVKALVQSGYREVVITGVDITSYGADLPGRPTLGQLVQRILRHVPDLDRLRLSSIDSVEADAALRDAIACESRLMPHLHLSLQSGDDLILKRMKRRHTRDDAIRFCADMRAVRPDLALGADLIAGFPTETEAMFENSLSLVEACGLVFLHVFPYSERAGTPAARMPQVPRAERKARAARLRAAGDARQTAWLEAQTGSFVSVLVETADGRGHSAQFAPVQLTGPVEPGTIVTAQVAAVRDATLMAQVADGAAGED